MAHSVKLACFLSLLAGLTAEKEQSRWSRQISSYTADISDWVPLPGPVQREPLQIKRQAIAEPRILSEPFPGFARPTGFSQDTFPSRMFINSPANRQLYLQSVPSAPQNYLTDQGFGQSIRFGLAQSNLPLNNVFVAPQFNFDSVPQFKSKPTPIPTTQIKFDNVPSIPVQSQFPMQQTKPFIQQQKPKIELPKFVDGYRVENISRDIAFTKKKPLSNPSVKFESIDKPQLQPMHQGKPNIEREEVQLLYVPLDSLNRGQFNFKSPLGSSQLVNTELFSQNPKPNPLKQNLAAELQSPHENYRPVQQQFPKYSQLNEFEQVPKFMTMPPIVTVPTTTPKPKKLKPHQPPLAIFLTQEAKKNDQIKVGDVLYSLKNANTVAVLDSVNPINAPKVFIGPNSLMPPENYVKFELPYLSNIDHSDRKLRQLPFFVAPLSYNTPQGFAKIPFPAPHVGSVVINSQIRDTSPSLQPTTHADVIPNSYTAPPQYKLKAVTQKPRFSYYSTTAPLTNAPDKYEPNYYSFEPQSVSTLRPAKESETNINTTPPSSGSYFLSNVGNQYDPSQYVNFPQDGHYRTPEYNAYKTTEATTKTPTSTTTTNKPPATYPSQLLETHNPYSINQAFHFSTPVDYQNFFDEYKEVYQTSRPNSQAPNEHPSSPQQPTLKPYEEVPEKSTSEQPPPSQPNHEKTYTPEMHYESEIPQQSYQTYNKNDYTTQTEPVSEYIPSSPVEAIDNNNYQNEPTVLSENNNQSEDNLSSPPEYIENPKNYPPVQNNLTELPNNEPATLSEEQSTKSPYEYNQYETIFTEEKEQSSLTPATTTTKRTPLRTRGRPRYTTSKSNTEEYSTRSVVTRRPLRERKPLPPRPRYEPNKVTTEKATRKSVDSNESTTRSYRTRSRGRVHYKPSEADDTYDKRNKESSKEGDLAYQRDVLHQNYPVTLMERMSTVDIEAITEPTLKVSSTNNLESTNTYDTENAYSNDQLSITQNTKVYTENKQQLPEYSETEIDSQDTYVPRISSTRSDDYNYHSRSSAAPMEAISSYDETKEEQDSYPKQTTPLPKTDLIENIASTKLTYLSSEHDISTLTDNDDVPTVKHEEETTVTNIQDVESSSHETKIEQEEPEQNIVHTTPSYNRVRVRPGVIRQYHQASSTESSRVKVDRKKSAQAITYRPAFDRRRTTMRIDEIQADLKTKQVLAHPENQDVHPVYKPEPTTDSSVLSVTQDTASKRGQFRRRRPTYTHTTTSTEASSTKKTYEVKNRFRGRRPTTEKPTEKPEVQTDITSTTVKSNLYNRYSHRPRISERFHKKTETEGTEDQDSNYSLHRPKYAAPDTEYWSPKVSSDSFKPYNPNDVSDTLKSVTTERKQNSDELDIITAKNEYDDILISVTPATNNKASKIPDIPPTLEALVEQSKVTKSDSGDSMSTFESMLEEVMKSLEEQDQDEYTKNVMKHKGGEIGEIPPEKIISSGEIYSFKSTTPLHEEATTTLPNGNESLPSVSEEDASRKSRRRGFWKKVKVRPVTESIEVAESQYYPNTVNRLGQDINSKTVYSKIDKNKPKVTTYKPSQELMKKLYENEDDSLDLLVSHLEIPKVNSAIDYGTKLEGSKHVHEETTKKILEKTTINVNPGDMDLGTGSPDPTLEDEMYYSDPTEPTINESSVSIDRSDGFSLMDYLFGVTSSDNTNSQSINKTDEITKRESDTISKNIEIETTTEQKPKVVTTETTYIPEEITAELTALEYGTTEITESKKVPTTENIKQDEIELTEKPAAKVETSSISSFMDPANVVSTSMSTEVSHETEICFRGKCIKTNKDLL